MKATYKFESPLELLRAFNPSIPTEGPICPLSFESDLTPPNPFGVLDPSRFRIIVKIDSYSSTRVEFEWKDEKGNWHECEYSRDCLFGLERVETKDLLLAMATVLDIPLFTSRPDPEPEEEVGEVTESAPEPL